MPWKYKRLLAPAVAWTAAAAFITVFVIANNGSDWINQGETTKDGRTN